MTLLIVADPWDIHSRAVTWAMQNAGQEVRTWYTHDFPQKHSVSLRVGGPAAGSAPSIELPGPWQQPSFRTDDVDTV
ncbi:MAG TPA: hypothetical protein VGQ93_15905, partial [Lysobacter sp.]|nr:hypothetical protein [Lysobacter sp.]